MPAYIQHREIDSAVMVCPCCVGLPMYVKDVEPHWSLAKIDFIYACCECGTEIRKTVTKPERRRSLSIESNFPDCSYPLAV